MHDAFFKVPVVVETTTPDEFRTLVSVADAAVFMMERWPKEHGPRYQAALQACTAKMANNADIEYARLAFLSAADEAGLRLKDEDQDGNAAPPVEDKSVFESDLRRRSRGRMEEEEDFLIRFVARETGITEAQARDLINMIGTDRSSLLREARILKAQH